MFKKTTGGLIDHARNTPGEIWEFECNDVGDDSITMPRINYTKEMYDKILGMIGDDWVGVYSLFDKPFPAHQTRKMVRDLAERGLIEIEMVVKMRKTLMARVVKDV